MSPRLMLLVLLLAGLAAPIAAADSTPAVADDSGSFSATQARIKVLFQGRDALPVVPDNIVNPFSPPAERRAPRGTDGVTAAPVPLSNRALLARVAPAIRVQGIVQAAAGRPCVVINQRRFSVGDRVTVQYGNIPVMVEIKRITGDTYTLAYKDAELTLRLSR